MKQASANPTPDTAARGPIRVMVIDDHAMVREGIVALLQMQKEFRVVAEAGDGESAITLYREHRPDVALVDLRLPGRDGVAVIQRLRGEFPAGRFLVLTTYDSEDNVVRAMQAGAHGYLLKGASRTALTDAIVRVHAGLRYIPPDLADRVLPRPAEESLSEREVEVLNAIAGGMNNKEIAEELGIAESTVKGHLNHVFSKLGVTDRTKALVLAVRRGLIRID
jgi:two-component system NarL family response regulator